MSVPEFCAKAFVAGHKIVEFPPTWRERTAGRSKFQAVALAAALLRVVLVARQADVDRPMTKLRLGRAERHPSDILGSW